MYVCILMTLVCKESRAIMISTWIHDIHMNTYIHTVMQGELVDCDIYMNTWHSRKNIHTYIHTVMQGELVDCDIYMNTWHSRKNIHTYIHTYIHTVMQGELGDYAAENNREYVYVYIIHTCMVDFPLHVYVCIYNMHVYTHTVDVFD